MSKFGCRMIGWVHAIKSMRFSDFLKISYWGNSYSLSGDSSSVRFYLWWRNIVLKREKVYKCFVQDWRSSYKKEVAAPDNYLLWKKSFYKKVAASSSCSHEFHYNCCSGNIVASIISLFRGDWCSVMHWKKVCWPDWITAQYG